MLTEVYVDLCAFIKVNVPSVKNVDIYNGQYERKNAPKEHPFNTPAVFIQYGDVEDWVEQGMGIQEADCEIIFHFVTTDMGDTFNIDNYNSTIQGQKLLPFTLDNLAHQVLQRYVPNGCVRELWRTKTYYDHDHDNLVVTKVHYHTRLQEIISNTALVPVPVNSVGVSGEIVSQLPASEESGPPVRIE